MSKPQFTRDEQGNFKVPLKRPYVHAEKEIKEVTLRGDPTVQDLEVMDKGEGEVQKSVYLIAELSGLSLAAVRKMKPMDFTAINGIVTKEILGNDSSETGGTS